MQKPAEIDIVRRAYELWEQAGEPDGRDQEFYHQAEKEMQQNKQTNQQNSRVSTASKAPKRSRNLGRQRFMIAIRNVIHLLGLQLHPLPNSSEARHVSSRQEAHVHRPRRRTGPAFWRY